MIRRVLLLACIVAVTLAHGRRCDTDSHMENVYRRYPGLKEKMQREDEALERRMKDGSIEKRQTIYHIPTVVHIVFRTAAENISTAVIYDQIARLNRDWRRMNDDRTNTFAAFSGVAADARIQFVFAETDPLGQPTSGITRTQTSVTQFDPDNDSCQRAINGGIDAWNPSNYMNIWVCVLLGDTLGYAQLPGGPAATDGIVVDTAAFGANGQGGQYNLGRTLTHEVGHWFNLRHPWGDGADNLDCSDDDFVADTPRTDQPHYTCTLNTIACGQQSMVQNYMDYTNDACMNIFTADQVTRARAVLTGTRAALPLASYSGVVPGVNDNWAPATTGSITGGDTSSDELIDLPFQIPGVGFWGTIAIIIVAGILALLFIAGCVGCLCCRGGRD